jgi:hypothetical protein
VKFESKLLRFILLGGLRFGVVQESCAANGLADDSNDILRRLARESGHDLAVIGGAVISNGVVKLRNLR